MDKPRDRDHRDIITDRKRVVAYMNDRDRVASDDRRYASDDRDSKRPRQYHEPHPGPRASDNEVRAWMARSMEAMREKLTMRYRQLEELRDNLHRARDKNEEMTHKYNLSVAKCRELEDQLAAVRDELDVVRNSTATKDVELYTMQQLLQHCNPQQLQQLALRNRQLEEELTRSQQSFSQLVFNPTMLQKMRQDVVVGQLTQTVQRERDQANRRHAELAAEVALVRSQLTDKETELRRSTDELRAITVKLRNSGTVDAGNAAASVQLKVQQLETELDNIRQMLRNAENRARDCDNIKRQLESANDEIRSSSKRIQELEKELRERSRECYRLREHQNAPATTDRV